MVDPDAPTPESIESTVWYLFANQHFIRERDQIPTGRFDNTPNQYAVK